MSDTRRLAPWLDGPDHFNSNGEDWLRRHGRLESGLAALNGFLADCDARADAADDGWHPLSIGAYCECVEATMRALLEGKTVTRTDDGLHWE